MPLERVTIIGGGAWGTALAQAAANAGREVMLVARDPESVEAINTRHRNPRHLGDQPLAEAISARTDFDEPRDFVILAVPAQASRVVLAPIGEKLAGTPVILSAKGLERGTLKRQSEILSEMAPRAVPLILSGPSFAVDVAAGRPTAVTLAGDDDALTESLAAALAGPALRPYAAGDRVGVELAGGLKNVYALACGAVEGAGLGASARAALIARAYAELSRLVVAAGGQASTLTGLAGLGDLTLSCTSTQSRNYRQGTLLGRGEGLSGQVGLAEGVFTAPAAQELAERLGVEAPLIGAVNLLLGAAASIETIVAGLMSRPLKREE